MKKTSLFGSFLLLMLFVGSCSNTKLLTAWKAPDEPIPSFNKVLVIAMMTDRDRKLRENVENVMVAKLNAAGIKAGSALAEYGPKALDGNDERATLKAIEDKGYDGTFTIALLDKSKGKVYNPGMIVHRPIRFWGYYQSVFARMYQPGYYSTSTKFILEANFYNLNPDKLLYSAQTQTVDPSSPPALANAFSDKIFDDMRKQGLIK